MRAAIKRFDGYLRRTHGVFEFTDEAWCIFRLQLRDAQHGIRLSDGTQVREGEPALVLHLWNEQIPPMRAAGPDVAWGATLARLIIRSLRAVAVWIESHPEVADRRVLGAATVLVGPGSGGGFRLFRRLGFDVLPFENLLGDFGEFWANLYTWGLMWAYNQASVRHRPPWRLRRTILRMPVDTLLVRYGSAAQTGPEPALGADEGGV